MMKHDDQLPFMSATPPLEDILIKDEYAPIREAATKLQERLVDANASDSVLTASRALIETVCRTLLDCLDVEYRQGADLLDTSKALAKALDLHPGTKTESALKQVCQGAISMINGICFLRNAHSDAHGKGQKAEVFSFRHSELTAYLSCSLTRYFVESYEAKNQRKSRDNLCDSEKDTLVEVWLDVGKKHRITNPDNLPYSEALEEIAQQFTGKTSLIVPRRDIYLFLVGLRKALRLPKPALNG